MATLNNGVVINLAGGNDLAIDEGGAVFNVTTLDTEVQLFIQPRCHVKNNDSDVEALITVITPAGATASPDTDADGNVVISYTRGG